MGFLLWLKIRNIEQEMKNQKVECPRYFVPYFLFLVTHSIFLISLSSIIRRFSLKCFSLWAEN